MKVARGSSGEEKRAHGGVHNRNTPRLADDSNRKEKKKVRGRTIFVARGGARSLHFYKVRSTEYGVDLVVEAPCGVCPVLSYAGRR
mgnify:CR=1 FL=1